MEPEKYWRARLAITELYLCSSSTRRREASGRGFDDRPCG